MKKRIALALAAALLAAACSAPATEDPTASDAPTDASLTYVTEKGSLILGLDEEFPPMGFRDDTGEIVGFDIDVAREACARLGVELVLQPIDWDAKELELDTKNIDCIWNGFSVNPARQEAHELSIPYLENDMALVVRSGEGIASPADLAGKSVAVQAGSSAMDAYSASEAMASTTLVEVDDNVRALLELETLAVDAVLMDDVAARYYITKNGKSFAILDETLASERYAVGFRKGEVALKDAVDAALRELEADGTLAEIAVKWFGSDTTIVE
jgi:polar amino acid transport system substrate-binding protein